MGFPVVPIITAVAPVVLRALDHYRQRSETQAQTAMASGTSADTLAARLAALEQSDLEQARLISDLSKQVEQLAQALNAQVEYQRARDKRQQGMFVVAIVVAVIALMLAVGVLLR